MNSLEEQFINCGDEGNQSVRKKEVNLILEYIEKPVNVTANHPWLSQLSLVRSLVRDKEKYLDM